MQYPLVLKNFPNNVKLYIPDPLLIKPTYEALLLENQATPFPFWAKVWPSAVALTTFLQQNLDLIKHKAVVEIGAGLGLPSFSIAKDVAEIVITDYSIDAVELMKINSEQWGIQTIKAICADWNFFPASINADIVLLSDTNYAPSEFESLLKLIQQFIKKGATIIIATPERITTSPFIEQLELYISKRDLIDITYNEEMATIGLFVLK
ncbi:methyltransferase [Sediminibacterium sp.]|uniref:class I SAM-dependent methyltransferase n=1 Tax=Sediminibacterium sp. TaxID=1917865 RepID=UPI0027366508|nr:methyltransferase domain-containing protein [Sediminibacterium sp.]MDP3394707.1 methyltransferase domain-containing protein [Sediminibacterium sp.]MDP3568542.1 methyltransferase domain-containing protein [Sediminibacterium sp.]